MYPEPWSTDIQTHIFGLSGQPKHAHDIVAILRAKKINSILDISKNGLPAWD